MKDLNGCTALVTGASGGLGGHIARRLAREGMNVVVSGRREDALAAVAGELCELGVKARAVPADLSDLSQIDPLIERSEAVLGPIDLLVNNAGVEITSAFTSYTREELTSMVDVNLTAPLLLTHRLVPGMLARERGHVVFISSAAGKLGPAYEGPYAATKAALIGLTQALRSEYLHASVGFSVICPGFIAGDGMYQRMVEEGVQSNRLLGETTTKKVTDKVVRAIRRDQPEVVETGAPIRPILALNQLTPRFVERLVPRFGLTELFRRVAVSRDRTASAGQPVLLSVRTLEEVDERDGIRPALIDGEPQRALHVPADIPDDHDTHPETDDALWLALLQAPYEGTDIGELMRITGWKRAKLYRHSRSTPKRDAPSKSAGDAGAHGPPRSRRRE